MSTPLVGNLGLHPVAAGRYFGDQMTFQATDRVTNGAIGSWCYRGGPRLSATYTNDWAIHKLYPFQARSQWNFSSTDMARQTTNLGSHIKIGGTTGGIVFASTLGPGYGAKTLYGAHCIPPGGDYGYCDYGRATDVDRQLNAVTGWVESQLGLAYWLARGAVVHHDDFTTLAQMWYYAGAFGSDMEASFSVPNYGALLRGLYANDAAYQAAARNNTRSANPPNELAWRRHLLRYCLQHAVEKVRPMHVAAGVESSYNGFAAIPCSWYSLCNLAVCAAAFDHAIVELSWTDTEPGTDRSTVAEEIGTPQRLLTMYARVAMACASMRMFGVAGVVAPYPLGRWLPPNNSNVAFPGIGASAEAWAATPPKATSYTESPVVAAHYRSICAWILACGQTPTLPIHVFDYLTNYLTPFGWTGVNRLQWTADPAQLAPIFTFHGLHRAQLFDGFETPPVVALSFPDLDERYSNSASNATTAAGDSWIAPTLPDDGVGPTWDLSRMKRYCRDYITPLMTRGIPWLLAMTGPGLDRTRTAAEYQFSKFKAVVKCENTATYTDAVAGSVADVPTGSNVQELAWLATGSNLTPLQFVTVNGATDATRPVLPCVRVHPDGRMAIHLVNTNNATYGTFASGYTADALNAAQSALTLRVRGDILGPHVQELLWFAPGQVGGRPLRMARDASGVTVTLPALTDYGVVLFP